MLTRIVTSCALAASATLTTVACSELPVSQQYLSQKTYGLYLTIPSDFTVLPEQDSSASNPDAPVSYLQVFHAPGGSTENLIGSQSLGGYMGMRVIPGDLAQAEAAAANAVVTNLDEAVQSGAATIVAGPTVTESAESYMTVQWTVELANAGNGPATVLNQSTVGLFSATGPGREEAHVVKTLVLGCSPECFAANNDVITRIAESWRFN